MIMTGGRDTKKSLKETLQWAVKNLDSAQFFPMGNIPGTRFDKRMRAEGKIICDDPSKIDGHHVVVRPENLSPYELQVVTDKMYYEFYSPINNLRRIARSPDRHFAIAQLGWSAQPLPHLVVPLRCAGRRVLFWLSRPPTRSPAASPVYSPVVYNEHGIGDPCEGSSFWPRR